ncbi:hypothetical protein ACHAXT_004294, partial [Thalassiosira profunda]
SSSQFVAFPLFRRQRQLPDYSTIQRAAKIGTLAAYQHRQQHISNMTGDASLTLTIRISSSVRFDIGSDGGITANSTIRQIKEIISQREESDRCAVERQRLIFRGRILSEDTRTLADYGIPGDNTGGIILYLVKGQAGASANTGNAGAAATTASAPAPAAGASAANPNASATSNPFLNFGNAGNANNPMASMMGSGGMPDLATFQQQLQQNPQMMSDMLNNPMVQSLMSNPDFMSNMMQNNPQMRQVMDSNPELRHALQDPEFMRRSMEMMRDPSAMQNAMRNQDLAMSQIENMPGGYNALRRMYEDVQEPMMDAMAGGTSGSGTSGSGTDGGSSGNGAAGATNQAMPNPWGAPAPSSSSANVSQGAGGAAAGANPFASLMGSMGGIPGAGGPGGAAANPWANPAMGANQPNLEATIQMMENPMMRQMMDSMMSNPETMNRMMESNPMLQEMRRTNPQAAAMFDNPEAMRAMMNPDNMRAMLQMQQAMQQLSGSMPGLQMPGMPPGAAGGSAVAPPPPAGGLDFSSLLGASSRAAGGGAAPAAPMANPFMFPFVPPAGGAQPGAAAGGSPAQQAPGQRFRMQLQNLEGMGFTDRSANIRALTTSHGNVNRAVEILLESPPEMGGSAESTAEGAGDGATAAATESQPDAGGNEDAAAGESSEPKDTTEKKND